MFGANISSQVKMASRAKLGYDVLLPVAGRPAKRSAIFMHGILGSGRNWRTPAKRVIKHFPEFQAVLVDHRGHGASTGGTPPHTLEACALDLHSLSQDLRVKPDVVCGHSFGGKVALALLQASINNGWELPRQIWVFDALPGIVDRHKAIGDNSVAEVIDKLNKVPVPYHGTKEQLVQHLTGMGIAPFIATWLITSVRRTEGGLTWTFDLSTVVDLFEAFTHTSYWDMLERVPVYCNVDFVRAGKNPAWTREILARFQELQRKGSNVHLHTLSSAGHWVHADDPDGLHSIISPSFSRLSQSNE